MGPTVHVLYHGLPLCGFSNLTPVNWEKGNLWVGVADRDKATCSTCSTLAERKMEDKKEGATNSN